MIAYLLQSQADLVRPPMAWLSAAEQAEYAALRMPRRRQDWLAGRWTAKRLIQATRAEAAGAPLAAIQLAPSSGRAPLASWPGCPQPWPTSISHCDGRAAAALCDEPRHLLGIDLERVEARSPAFADDYFTLDEIASLGRGLQAQAEQVTAIWCGKEAALKALGLGLTVDTRSVSVRLKPATGDSGGWRLLEVDAAGAQLEGCWRRQGPYVLTIVSGAANGRVISWPVEVQSVGVQEKVA